MITIRGLVRTYTEPPPNPNPTPTLPSRPLPLSPKTVQHATKSICHMQHMACIPVHMLALSHSQDHTGLQTRLHQLTHKTVASHVHIPLATL